MTNIYKVTCDALKLLGYPAKEQGTYAADDVLPETFTTYFLVDSPNNSHADNVPTSKTSRMQVVLYTKKPLIKQEADSLLKSVMLSAGFMRVGGGDLPYNQTTGHYAFRCDYKFYEREA